MCLSYFYFGFIFLFYAFDLNEKWRVFTLSSLSPTLSLFIYTCNLYTKIVYKF